jgi:pimeloyl-ACP methyl ester carboxylesterase
MLDPMFEAADCEFTPPPDRMVECGWVEVPESRDDPSGEMIRLHVGVFASESPTPAPDPVVYLAGGPGSDALELVPLTFEDAFSHLLADRDVIMFDQRGTGFSEPSLACPEFRELELASIEQDLPADEYAELQLADLEACRNRLTSGGPRLASYTSAENAADLDDLRRALGYDQWNLYGISYGTRLALTAMRDFPEGIRSVVLDSTYPPDVDIIADTPGNFDRALRQLFDGCAADAACTAAYPNLEETFYGLLLSLEGNPLRAPVTDVFTGETYDAVFDGAALGGMVFQSLYSEDAIEVLPQLISNVAAGETYEVSVLASSFLANGEFVSIGMLLSVQCHEELGFTSPAIADAALDEYPRLAPIFETSPTSGNAFFDICAAWDVPEAPQLENEPVSSGLPTLILAGEYDPITPPSWGERAAATLTNATFAEFPGMGHGPSAGDDCPQSIMRAFLVDPGTDVATDCIAAMKPPAFVTADTPVPEVTLVPYTEDLLGSQWSGVVPDGWERQAAGTWARALNGFDQAVIIQQLAAGAAPELIVGLLGPQLGLGDVPQPTESYTGALGDWSIYEGNLAGAPISMAVIEVPEGSFLVALVTPPSERDRLRSTVFFPALDAITTE